MLGYIILLFTLVPAIELYLLIEVGSSIGAGNTILIIVMTGIVGAYLAKSQGLSILTKIQVDLAQGNLPTREIILGFLVFGGGILLLTPGFLTDLLGFCMILPGPRHFILHFAENSFKKAIKKGTVHVHTYRQDFTERKNQDIENANDVFEADYKKKTEKRNI